MVIIVTINSDFRLPSMATVCKKSHSVSLMGLSWYWKNSHLETFGPLLFRAPIHTRSIPATLVSLSHFIVHRPVTLLGHHCHLGAWSPPVSLRKLTQQRSLQKQRP